MKKIVIFDLDGTLLNTIADLAAATNHALTQCGFPTHDTAAYNAFVGNGIYKLFERALPENDRTTDNIQNIKQAFVPYYDTHNCALTRPYDGIEALLAKLQQRHIKLAVASNKYQAATEKLVQHFFPTIAFAAILGQREGIPMKPDPRIVADILAQTHLTTTDTLYVGDSGVDMQTAKNASVTSVGVTWGFRPQTELEQFAPDFIAQHPNEIAEYIFSE